MDNHDRYIYATSFNEYEDEKLTECFEQLINDEDFRAEALCIINKNHNDSDPEDSDLFREIIYEFCHEHLKE